MIKKYLLALLLFTCQLSARANFNFDTNCVDAYKAILSLRIPEAKLLLKKEQQQNPKNGIIILLDNYIDYFSLLASENKNDYEKWSDNKSARISALERNDKNSPFYLFSLAEVHLQWSFLKAKFGDYLSSALDAKKAGNLLKENAEKYPDFSLNQKGLALVNVIFGSVPPSLKGVTRFLGMSGNVETGLKQLETLKSELPKSKYSFYNDEVVFFLCNINIDVLHNSGAYPKLISCLSDMEKNSLLKAFLQGHAASKTAHNDDAIIYLEASPRSNQYLSLPAIDYLLGNAKLNRMDTDASFYLEKYVTEFKGINYIKDACLKIGYCYLLQNDQGKYSYFINLAKSKGYAVDEKDKQALKEANDAKPDIDLLKARFYFDGGYYEKALFQIENNDVNKLKLLRDKVEFYYRLGRIYDKTDKITQALLNYQRAINLGKTTGYYYAANAALNMGRIYEEKRDFKKSAEYYNQALDMRGHEYQNSIDDDAKEGLKRINK